MLKITEAKTENIEAILALQTQIYRVDTIAPNGQETLEKQLKNDSCLILVAKLDDKVIGTATIYYINVAARGRPYAFLEGLVIHEDHRGNGHGTAFFKKCLQIAKEKNCYKMLFTSGLDRQDAHKFYEKLGFKKWGYEFRMDL